MKRCLSHESCDTGFCNKEGLCTNPQDRGDPCKLSQDTNSKDPCPQSYKCHAQNQRCLEPTFTINTFCETDEDCSIHQYCQRHFHLCDPRAEEGAVCGPAKRCGDGMECVRERCWRRCFSSADCANGHTCVGAGVGPYDVCLPRELPLKISAYFEYFVMIGGLGIVAFFFFTWWIYRRQNTQSQ